MKFEIDAYAAVAGITVYAIYRLASSAKVNARSASNSKKGKEVEATQEEIDSLDSSTSTSFNNEPMEEPGAEPQPESAPELAAALQQASLAPASLTTTQPYVKVIPAVTLVVVVAVMVAYAFASAFDAVPSSSIVEHVEQVTTPALSAAESKDKLLGRVPAAPPGVYPPISIALERQRMAIATSSDVLYYKIAYYGKLKLGKPATDYTFVFDTGSGHLIVPSSYCNSDSCKAHKRYRRSSSSSALDIDHDGTYVKANDPRDQLTVQFGTGEVSGVFVEELVCTEDLAVIGREPADVGGQADSDELPPGCMRMRIIAATEMSSEPFKTFSFDGVLGLGLDPLSRTPEFNFMNMIAGTVQRAGSEMPSTFAMFLGEGKESSELLLGGWSENHLATDLYWNPVYMPEHGHWMVKVNAVRVDDKVLDYCLEGCRAVVDSGTSLMSVPTVTFPELYENLRHSAPIDGLCKSQHGPKLHFDLDHFTVTMDPEDYSRPEWYKKPKNYHDFGASDGVHVVNNVNGSTRSDMYCRPMLMTMDIPAPVGPKLFILGEPVLRKYYTVYDTKELRVGMGLANHKRDDSPEPEVDVDGSDDSWFFEDEPQ